jgi:hypothetical protein
MGSRFLGTRTLRNGNPDTPTLFIWDKNLFDIICVKKSEFEA